MEYVQGIEMGRREDNTDLIILLKGRLVGRELDRGEMDEVTLV